MTERTVRKMLRERAPFRKAAGVWAWYRLGHLWSSLRGDELWAASLLPFTWNQLDGWFESQLGCKQFWTKREAALSLIRAARAA